MTGVCLRGEADRMIGETLAVIAPPPLPLQTSSTNVGHPLLVPAEITAAAVTPGRGRRKEDRIPQWGYHETKEFISIRAELEKDFTQTKRNKTLWELIAGKMKEKGFRRSADQCKCKWKNLVNRYKGSDEASDFSPVSQLSARVDDELASGPCVIGKETAEVDNGRQCAFFEELDAIFKERAKNMDRLLLESESGSRPNKKKAKRVRRALGGGVKSSEDDTEEDEDEDGESEDERMVRMKKRKADKERQRVTAEKYRANSMQEVLEDFFQQQQRLEEQWREAMERREQERRVREQGWRDAMEKLEQERISREQAWREREEQRRAREEARAEKRDNLFAALISKLAQEDV